MNGLGTITGGILRLLRKKTKMSTEEKKAVKIVTNLHDGGSEAIWATSEPGKPDCYRVVNIPWFATGFTYDDVVRCEQPDPHSMPCVIELVEDSGNLSLVLERTQATKAEMESIMAQIMNMGGEPECALAYSLYSVLLSAQTQADRDKLKLSITLAIAITSYLNICQKNGLIKWYWLKRDKVK